MSSVSKVLKRSSVTLIPQKCSEVFYPKPFSEVPGPVAVPFLGSNWKYLPLIGNWDINKLHVAGALKLAEFGPIVREEISKDLKMCHVFRAEDIELVYKSEGRFPARRSHLALGHYRLSRPHIYNSGGLLPTNGCQWWQLRSSFQKHISPIQDIRSFLKNADNIITDFIKKFLFNGILIDDFLPLVSKLYLELMWFFMFGKRLGSFELDGGNSIPGKLIEAAETVNASTIQTDSTEKIWKLIKTPIYKKMESSLEFIEKVILEEIDNLIQEKGGKFSENGFLIEKYLQMPQMDRKDLNGMAVDLILGSVDTTSYTTSFLMYNLSQSFETQKMLQNEVETLLKEEDSPIDSSILNNATFTRAVLKESFRLNPITVGISRYLVKDTVFSGYLIPKGTLMMTQNLVACLCEDHFAQAEQFRPERWVKTSPLYSPSVSPFLVLPFSHGPRTCIARRLAEQNLMTFLLRVSRKYSISWQGGSLGIITPLICKPDGPISLKFNEWTSFEK